MPQKMKMTKRWHWLTPSLTRAALSISRKVTHLFTCLGIFGPGHVAAAAVTNTFLWLVWKIFFRLRVPSCICDWSQTHTQQKEQTVKFWIILWLYLWFRQVFDNNDVIFVWQPPITSLDIEICYREYVDFTGYWHWLVCHSYARPHICSYGWPS